MAKNKNILKTGGLAASLATFIFGILGLVWFWPGTMFYEPVKIVIILLIYWVVMFIGFSIIYKKVEKNE